MSAVSRWQAQRPQEPSAMPNPGAGATWGRPRGSRPEGSPVMGQNSGSDWHPTVVNLMVLIFLELIAYAILRYVFQNVKGI